jgi:hypothetical protein
MKKKLLLGLVALVAFFCTKNAFAMTEAELTAKVKATYNINGNNLTVPQKYVNMYEDYVSQYELTSEDCQYVADQIDKLVAAAKANGVTKIEDLDNKCKSELRQACADVSANTGVKATILSDGRVSVSKYNNKNEVFGIVDVNIATNTGSANILYIAGVIALIGAGLLVFKVKKA